MNEIQLIIKARNGDQEAFSELLKIYKPLLFSIANKYSPNVADAYQSAMLGLWIAIKKFNPAKRMKFSSYVYLWARRFVRRFEIYPIKYSQYYLFRKIRQFRLSLDKSDEEVSRIMDVDREGLVLLRKPMVRDASGLYQEVGSPDFGGSLKLEDYVYVRIVMDYLREKYGEAFEAYLVSRKVMNGSSMRTYREKLHISRKTFRTLMKCIDEEVKCLFKT
jgi:RNA polymerase sigma factor (sigma-70 family)